MAGSSLEVDGWIDISQLCFGIASFSGHRAQVRMGIPCWKIVLG